MKEEIKGGEAIKEEFNVRGLNSSGICLLL